MSDLKRQENILHQLIKSREAIRRKYNLLKYNKASLEKAFRETFKPIVKPLDKLVELSEKNVTIPDSPKKIPHENKSDYDSDATLQPTEDLDLNSAESESEANNTVVERMSSPKNSYLLDTKHLDKIYGVYKKDNKLFFGNSPIIFDKGDIFVQNEKFPQTSGLLELLFRKDPNLNIINHDDLSSYRDLMILTSAHKRRFEPNGDIRRHKSKKFNRIISDLFDNDKIGGGFLPQYKIARSNLYKDYVYWDDPNELVERLKLLVAERSAGNNAHNNEIHSIIEELREAGYIY